jgi:hypothetical protein
MGRIIGFAFAILIVGVLAPPAGAASSGHDIDGTMTGSGAFVAAGCATIEEIGSGTFKAQGLGLGTYEFSVCIAVGGVITFDGFVTLTTSGNSTITGDISGSFTGATPGPQFDVIITGGTKKYANATGVLTLGPLMESNFTNCDPRVGICLNWTDTGPLTGTIRR